jgi:hypothetical protein
MSKVSHNDPSKVVLARGPIQPSEGHYEQFFKNFIILKFFENFEILYKFFKVLKFYEIFEIC